jgi:putative flavoprotein involved in K+ transport
MPVVDRPMPADTPAAGPASEEFVGNAPSGATGRELADSWLRAFEAALKRSDKPAIRDLFLTDGYWRDILALTWDFRTFAGPELVANGWTDALRQRFPARGA